MTKKQQVIIEIVGGPKTSLCNTAWIIFSYAIYYYINNNISYILLMFDILLILLLNGILVERRVFSIHSVMDPFGQYVVNIMVPIHMQGVFLSQRIIIDCYNVVRFNP